MDILKRKEKIFKSQSHHYNAMSLKTKDFIKKICYRKTASVDMTQYGFIADSKIHPWRVLMKPLKDQLEKICGKTATIDCSVECRDEGCGFESFSIEQRALNIIGKPIRSNPPGKQTPAKRNEKAMINPRTRRLSVINKRIKPSYVKDGSKRRITKLQNDKMKSKILKAVNKKMK